MKNYFLKSLTLCLVATLLAVTGCKSYDSDIDEINDRLDNLETIVASIENDIANGQIVTSVAKTEDGIEIALSNGQSYKITNGKDASNVITIGENGNWFIDGVDTGKRAVGKDATYWYPNEDGYWHYVDPETKEDVKSSQKWMVKDYITAIYTDTEITFYNVEGAPDGKVTISLIQVQSIQWIPSYTTSTGNYDVINSYFLDETSVENLINTNATVKFRFSPASMASKVTADMLSVLVDTLTTKAQDSPSATITEVTDLQDGKGTVAVTMNFSDFVPFYADEFVDKYITSSLKLTKGNNELTSDQVYFKYSKENYFIASIGYGYVSTNSTLGEYLTTLNTSFRIPYSTAVEDSKLSIMDGNNKYVYNDLKCNFYIQYYNQSKFHVIPATDAKKVFGKAFKIAYTEENPFRVLEAFNYSSAGKEDVTDDISNSLLQLTVPAKLDWDNQVLPTVEFKDEMTLANAGTYINTRNRLEYSVEDTEIKGICVVDFGYQVYYNFDESLSFEATVPWTYDKIQSGMTKQLVTPTLTLDPIEIKTTGTQIPYSAMSFMMLYSNSTMIGYAMLDSSNKLIIMLNQNTYKWGDTLDDLWMSVRSSGVEYRIKGKITFGAIAENAKYTYEGITLPIPTGTSTPSTESSDVWSKAYDGQSAYFSTAEQFAEVVLAGTSQAYTHRINSDYGDQTVTKSIMTVDDNNAVCANVYKSDIKAAGDKFIETMVFTTWYGQTITFTKEVTLSDN